MSKSNKQRQADYVERQRAMERVGRKVWVHRDDWPLVVSYVDRLNRLRNQRYISQLEIAQLAKDAEQ